MIGALLDWLYRAFGATACPGDWAWTLFAVGVLAGLCTVVSASGVLFLARWSSRRRGVLGWLLPGTIGLLGGCALPLALLAGASSAVPAAALRAVDSPLTPPGAGDGLSDEAIAGFREAHCFMPQQSLFMASERNVVSAIVTPDDEPAVYAARLATLLLVPLVTLSFLGWLARSACRDGPRGFSWVLLAPFLLLVAGSTTLRANIVGTAWPGYLAAIILGAALVPLLGLLRPRPRAADAKEGQPPGDEQVTTLVAGSRADDTSPRSPDELATGRFQTVRELGRGGFGAVWLCVDTELNRQVAVKFAESADEHVRQRMRREAKALAAVRHPRSAYVHDLIEKGKTLAIVMEYIDGRSLTQLLNNDGALDDIAVARLWATTASALHAAHQAGVLHRDVKPDNVVVDNDNEPYLIDFGIARAEGDASLTIDGHLIGTPNYLAPEVAAGGEVSKASDIWQLAGTVNYALTGDPPRGHRSDAMQVLAAAVYGEPCRALAQDSTHRALLERCLASDPADRPELPEVIETLRNWLAEQGEAADGPLTAEQR